ncbi:hypothetical protein AF42_05434, partial [Citrobacter freundii MGH 56]
MRQYEGSLAGGGLKEYGRVSQA